jgi:hypothetical protein
MTHDREAQTIATPSCCATAQLLAIYQEFEAALAA